MNKKILTIIVLAVIIIFGYFYYQNNSVKAPTIENKKTQSPIPQGGPDSANATYIIENESVTLSQGHAEKDIIPGSALKEETFLTDKIAIGDLNNDGKKDSAVILARSGGGSGFFIYVGAVLDGDTKNKDGLNTLFLGDRITVNSISINSQGVITVEYLDRNSTDAMTDTPTVKTTKQFKIVNNVLTEIK